MLLGKEFKVLGDRNISNNIIIMTRWLYRMFTLFNYWFKLSLTKIKTASVCETPTVFKWWSYYFLLLNIKASDKIAQVAITDCASSMYFTTFQNVVCIASTDDVFIIVSFLINLI